MVEFGILGPLTVDTGGGAIRVLPPKQRILLASLLLHANRIVSVDTLIEAVWDGAPPPSSRVTVQGHIKRLRHLLGSPGSERIVTRGPGYLLVAHDGELDLHRFSLLSAQARSAAAHGDWAAAARRLHDALSEWRGDPLIDVPSAALLRAELPRLSELRIQALELRVEADLQIGDHGALPAELRRLTAAYPLRERFHAQLMLALYRNSRQAEAMEAYRSVRTLLTEELGVDPGPELQQLHQRILAADPALTRAPHATATASASASAEALRAGAQASPPPPRQLPADVADFTGRGVHIKQLCDLLAAGTDTSRPGAVVISGVAGSGGVGKTTLAIHVAHRLADVFPDGQLYASLQGVTSPVDPGEVLAWFLRALGVPDSAIPVGEAERAARYRTLLAARRMLIVLDDARDGAQVRPLLPGTTTCAVIATSRRALADLAGAALLDLGVLDQDEARALFTTIVGPERAAREPAAAAEVLACCGGLPLAIRIAATRLAARPSWSIASLAARLADERRRLNELTAGDLAVRASFAVSYHALPASDPHPAGIFRLLGLAGTPPISLPAVAALAGRPEEEVACALDVLIDAHLLETTGPGRYRLHDLLRIYAAELGEQAGSQEDRRAAVRRLLDWYRQMAIAAAYRDASSYRPSAAADGAFAFGSPQVALDWCEAERANLVAATLRAAELGMPDIAAQIPAALWSFFQRRPYQDDWLATHEIGIECARQAGDAYTEGWLLDSLGKLHARAGRFGDADRCLAAALAIRRRLGDRGGEARTLNTIGCAYLQRDLSEPGLDYLRQALAIESALGNRTNVGVVSNNIGEAFRRMRDYEGALGSLLRALGIFREAGDRYGEGITELTLGETYEDIGLADTAIDHYLRALAAHDDAGPEDVERANALRNLAETYRSLGRAAEAQEAWLAALPILDRLGDPGASEIRARLDALADT